MLLELDLCLDFNKFIFAITILRLTLKQYNCEVSQANLDNFIKSQNSLDILLVDQCEERILSNLCNYENENDNEANNGELSSDYCSPEKKILSGEIDSIKEIKEINDETTQVFNVDNDTYFHSQAKKGNDIEKCLIKKRNFSQLTHYNLKIRLASSIKVPEAKIKSILYDNKEKPLEFFLKTLCYANPCYNASDTNTTVGLKKNDDDIYLNLSSSVFDSSIEAASLYSPFSKNGILNTEAQKEEEVEAE